MIIDIGPAQLRRNFETHFLDEELLLREEKNVLIFNVEN